MALDLECVTSRPAAEWLAVQASAEIEALRNFSETMSRAAAIRARAEVEALAPVRDLVRRGYVTAQEPAEQLVQVKDLLGDDETLSVSAKRSVIGSPLSRSQRAWIAIARKKALSLATSEYDEIVFANFAARLPRRILTPSDFEPLQREFADLGVAVVHVPPLSGGRIDGVTLKLVSKPMIALSGRGKRLDKVLFALLHECAHIVMGHWRDSSLVHEGNHEQQNDDAEIEAAVNALASSWAFPRGLAPTGPLTRRSVDALGEMHGVAPCLVVGHLQHAGILDWSSALSRGLPNVEEHLMTWK